MNTATRWFALVIAASAISCSAPARLEAPPERPNIIFIFADDHAAHAVSAYGSKINTTPNLDRLETEGMLFENAFVTNSICGPSRATVLTGQFGHLNGVPTNRDTLHSTRLTFPKLLQQSGYSTAVIGKWHLKVAPAGFDHYEVLRGQGPYYNPTLYSQSDTTEHVGYSTDIITDRALNWIESVRSSPQPFLLMYQFNATHRWWDPGPDHLNLFADSDIAEPATLFDDYEGRTTATQEQEMTIALDLTERDLKLESPRGLNAKQQAAWDAAYGPRNDAYEKAAPEGDARTRWRYQRYIKDYLRCVQSIDDNVGRLLDYLESTGLASNTVVVYTSDQGFFLGDHGWFDKRWMYEESLRTPLMIRWPDRVPSDVRNTALVQNLDIAPTFLDLAGISVPTEMQGESLAPLLQGRTPDDWRDAIYYQYFEYPGWHMVRRHYGVRTHRYKLIHYYEIGEWELFDLQEDPDELRSVFDDPAYADVLAEMRQRLAELRKQYDVPDEDGVPYTDFPSQRDL
ncbi:MAG: sulfatase [Rhodothermia bacterium]|nr:sulfatase [Rhodothermia bacterium]